MDDKKIIGFECRKGLTTAKFRGYGYSDLEGLIRTLLRECGFKNYRIEYNDDRDDLERVKFSILIQDEKLEIEFPHHPISDYTYSDAYEALAKIKDMIHWARNLPEWSVEVEFEI